MFSDSFSPVMPPHSIEAEQSLIGGLLLDNTAWDRIADMVTERDFYRDDHRRIFRHISLIAGGGQHLDVVTVYASITKAAEVEQTGGLAYLGEIANATPSAANIRRYAEIVVEQAALRRLMEIGYSLVNRCSLPGRDSSAAIISQIEGALAVAGDDGGGEEPALLADVFGEALQYIDTRIARRGLMTGVEDFDALTCGLDPGQLVVLAARPSVGKTALACQIADYLACAGKAVLFHSLEMGREQIGMRLMASRSSVSVHSMRAGAVPAWGWSRLADSVPAAAGQRVWIDDKPAVSVAHVRGRARRLQRMHGLDLVIIDHLGLMGGGRGDSRAREVGSITNALKALAKELRVPILLLVQLNRASETRTDKRPILSDLRDSGEIEQDADIVAMLHREALYNQAPWCQGFAELLVRKHRDGPLGDVLLRFGGASMSFGTWEGDSPRPENGGWVPKRFRD